MRDASSFKRKEPQFRPQLRVLVLCEDSKSSKTYYEDAAKHFRAYALVEIAHCGNTDPLGIVTEALRREKNFERIYCAIDRDSHHSWDSAHKAASGSRKVKVIASYPCFELWLLLHFTYSRAPYVANASHSAGEQLLRDLRKISDMSDYAKGNVTGLFATLVDRLSAAITHAKRGVQAREAEGEPNPSTEIHLLIQAFEELSKPLRK
jgi:hypothetical protein